jgi:hypothetical protein
MVKRALNAIRQRTNGSMVSLEDLVLALPDVPRDAILAVLDGMQRDNLLMLCSGDIILI